MENKDKSLRQFIDDSFNEIKDKFKLFINTSKIQNESKSQNT